MKSLTAALVSTFPRHKGTMADCLMTASLGAGPAIFRLRINELAIFLDLGGNRC